MNRQFLILGALSLSTLASLACSSAPAGSAVPDETPAASQPASIAPSSAAPPDASAGTAPSPAGSDDAGPSQPPSSDDAALPAPLPAGTLLAQGANLGLDGITDDGFVAYTRAGTVAVAPIGGGASTFVKADRGPTPQVKVSGPGVFVWSPPLIPNTGDALDVWTSARGLTLLASGVIASNPIATSVDGTKAAFFAGAELNVAGLDGTRASQVGSLQATALAFDGLGDLVATGPAGAKESLSVFAAPTFAQSFAGTETARTIDPTGSWLWVVGDDGAGDATGALVQASDGSIAFSDTEVSGPAFFDADGARLVYVAGDALKVVSLATPGSATTLVASEVRTILALSADGEHVIYQGFTGAFLQPTTASGATEKLGESSGVNSARASSPDLAGPAPTVTYSFTSDSSYVTSLTSTGQGEPLFAVRPIARSEVVARGYAESITPLAGSNILVIDQQNDGLVIDLSGTLPTIHVPQMGAFALSKDRAQFAYISTGAPAPGLYSVSTSR